MESTKKPILSYDPALVRKNFNEVASNELYSVTRNFVAAGLQAEFNKCSKNIYVMKNAGYLSTTGFRSMPADAVKLIDDLFPDPTCGFYVYKNEHSLEIVYHDHNKPAGATYIIYCEGVFIDLWIKKNLKKRAIKEIVKTWLLRNSEWSSLLDLVPLHSHKDYHAALSLIIADSGFEDMDEWVNEKIFIL